MDLHSKLDNLLTYIKWRGDLSFSILPFSIEDQLIFATLSYVNFASFVRKDENITLLDACSRVLNAPYDDKNFRVKKDMELLEAIIRAPRFSSVIISDIEDHFDKGRKQFFACTFSVLKDVVIAYRGTDNTVTGWKEDFDMAYEDEVPSQKEALKYLSDVASKTRGKIILTGHSKGGNLAVYAAANANKRIKRRISAVYNNDGPGFNENSKTHEKILDIEDRIVTVVPESSMIGMLMIHSHDYLIVASSARFIMQHDPYSWLFDGPHFKYERERSNDSHLFESVISSWLSEASGEDRMIFVESLFKCINEVGIEDLKGNTFEILAKTPNMIRSFKSLDEGEKKTTIRVLKNLVASAKDMMFLSKKEVSS